MKKVFFLLGAIVLMSFSNPSDAQDVDLNGNCCTVNLVVDGEELPLVTVCNGNVSILENCAAAQQIVDDLLAGMQ